MVSTGCWPSKCCTPISVQALLAALVDIVSWSWTFFFCFVCLFLEDEKKKKGKIMPNICQAYIILDYGSTDAPPTGSLILDDVIVAQGRHATGVESHGL